MTSDDFKTLQSKYKHLKTNNFLAFFIIFALSLTTLSALYLSTSESWSIWLLGQVILGVNIISWFAILHDLGHNHFFSNKRLNSITGHLASFICILPYYPWKYIHREHHVWTGWKDRDPTMTIVAPRDLSQGKRKFVNLCWKCWIPIMTLSFSFDNFWNIRKLFRMYPSWKFKWRNTFSIIFLITAYTTLIYTFGWSPFFKIWGLGYLIFLLISDPLLLSQHSGVPQMISKEGVPTKKVHFKDQEQYTRGLIFPKWISSYILIGFNSHILHHFFPTLPGYRLVQMDENFSNSENWMSWLVKAKNTDAIELLFENIIE
ncbi:hypothetical protein A9Q84_19715 [Halobacteriovorax marinus]|uniref:Fatty acid desaturase domain-containing protein n=1 Tax=Halobacteriovorax marinus TaxID=97084 RepID=A0A1Y5F378_9BACT|nr:hypothetical protein A9Q84_19715 [Halobacteriovorax marinus]